MTPRTISLAGIALLLAAGIAHAAPLSAPPLIEAGVAVQVIPAADGCGFGEHRGPYGGCRINNGPRGAIRAELTGLPRGCPPGMHRGLHGTLPLLIATLIVVARGSP